MSFVGGTANDKIRTRQILQKLSVNLGAKSVPVFSGVQTSDQIISTLPDGGLSPFKIVSKVLNQNLNAEFINGHRAEEFIGGGGAGGTVQRVLATAPLYSSAGVRPTITIVQTEITNLNSALTTGLLKIATTTGLLSSITDNSSNWNTAYTDRYKWDGGDTGLNAGTGRTSLGLGSAALNNTGDFLLVGGTAVNSALLESHNAAYFQVAGSYQPLMTNLTSLAALTFVSTSFVKMTLAGTFGLDTATYLTSVNLTTATTTNLTGFIKGNGSVLSADNSTYLTALTDTLATVMARGATTALQLTSTLAIGTSPFAVTSTTVNTNLNADLWDGYEFASYLNQAVLTSSSPSFVTATLSTQLIAPLIQTAATGSILSLQPNATGTGESIGFFKSLTTAQTPQPHPQLIWYDYCTNTGYGAAGPINMQLGFDTLGRFIFTGTGSGAGGQGYFLGYRFVGGFVNIGDDTKFAFGDSNDSYIRWSTVGNDFLNIQTYCNTAADSGNIVINSANTAPTSNYPTVANPTLRIQATSSTIAHYIQFYHDQTNGIIDIGTGNLNITPAGGIVAVTGAGSFTTDVKAATFHVGTDAGIDATVSYVDTLLGAKTLSFKKGILTAQA